MLRPLFVYGTLRDGDLLSGILGRTPSTRPASAPGFAAVNYPARAYPALMRRCGAEAIGLLVENLSPAERDLLDAYEGAEYRRAALRVGTSHGDSHADAYLPATEIAADAPAWRLEDWQANHKPKILVSELAAAKALQRQLADKSLELFMPTDILATNTGPLAITPINHASLVLALGDQVLYFDPVGPLERFAGLPAPTHLILTLHHDDHLDVPTLNDLFHDGVVIIGPHLCMPNCLPRSRWPRG